MALLSVDALTVVLDGQTILDDVSFDLSARTWTGLLGPNGSGKTTLLRAIGTHVPFEGTITLDGRPVGAWSAAERARRVATVQQAPSLTFDFTVRDLVLLGRTPHRGWLQRYQSDDRERVQAALRRVDLDGFADRSVLSLSGGERQRVFLAQALVQEADLLLLDEPTTHLDVQYQFSVLQEVQALVAEGRTVMTVFHDLERAARYAERLLILDEGRLVADGPPAAVLTPNLIAEVFGMEARVESGADGGVEIDYVEPVSDDASRPPASPVTNS
ncbi:MAG: ABC transporter [Bacteroidetes bacterium SW_9_63_38]|nr:MAG: ABC transporter [Bacteroidetes bacterium SW_9_63_38]